MSAVMSGPFDRGRVSPRALNAGILVSLVLHAALLFLVSLEREGRRASSAPGPIVARLVAPKPAAVQPQPPQPELPKPRAPEPPPKPSVTKPVVKPAPVVKPSPIPLPVPKAAPEPTPPPAPAAPAAPAAPEVPAAPAAPSAPPSAGVASPAPPVAAPPAASSADAATLEAYRLDLMRAARRYKRYPRVAMENNWEGRVMVRMVIGANGMISSLTVVDGSGHEVLDKQALDMLRKAKPLVPIPASMRGREFPLEIPVIYNLKDQASG